MSEINEIGNEAPDLIDHLIGYGIVEKVGDDFDIKVGAIRSALNSMLLEDSTESRWAEISARRNKLESEMRVVLFNWARNISGVEFNDIFAKNLTKKRKEGLPSLEPRILFAKVSSPLYLSDMLMLLKDERVLPFLEDERSEIVRYLNLVNKLRTDAHANDLTEEEMGDLRVAFDFLEMEFLSP